MSKLMQSRSTPWQTIVLTCGKCARKLDGGYGPKGKDKLRTVLRDGLKEAGHRRDVRMIETKCLGICPKSATTMIVATRPDRVHIVPAGASSSDALALVLDVRAAE
jgi:predicted metal-binding protein